MRRRNHRAVFHHASFFLVAVLLVPGKPAAASPSGETPSANAPANASTPDPEPTPEETLILEYVNRFRQDPASDIERIRAVPHPRKPHPELDWEMFRREMEGLSPAPPLVFNPRLILAARNHCRYVIGTRDYRHQQTPGRPMFTGEWPRDRVWFVGGDFDRASECFVGHSASPWALHWGLILDDGPGGPGGMQEGRGHRQVTIASRFREFGAGFIRHPPSFGPKESWCGVELFATRNARRRVGGVMFLDLDEDGFYDIGEGIGGALIQARDGRQCFSWKSGAYSLELARSGAVTLRAELPGLEHVRRFPAGDENLKFDFDAWKPLRMKLDELLEEAAGLARGKRLNTSSGVNLLLLSAGLPLPSSYSVRIEPLVVPFREELALVRGALLEALDTEKYFSFRKKVRESSRPYRGTLAEEWFGEIEEVARAVLDVGKLEKRFRPSREDVAVLGERIARAHEACRDEALRSRLFHLAERMKNLESRIEK